MDCAEWRAAALLVCTVLVCAATGPAARGGAVDTAFTYQGQLKQGGVPANGVFDFQFTLRQANGVTLVDRVCAFNVVVENGLFQAEVEFAASGFDGSTRLLQVGVRNAAPEFPDCSPNTIGFLFDLLTPLQPINAAPYALHAFSAPTGSSLNAPDGSPVNALVVDNAGRVGMGTTTPQAELHVRPPAGGTLGTLLVTPGIADSSAQIKLTENTSATLGSILRYDGAANQIQVLGLSTGGVEVGPHMVVGRDNGRVGIGTTAPQAKLHIAGTPGTDGIMFPDGSVQVRAVNVIRATVLVNLLSLSPGEGGIFFLSVPGAPVGGVAHVSPLEQLTSQIALTSVRVSSANTVMVSFRNVSTATVDPPPINWTVAVIP
ncbi:MAG: hypothetical protein Q7R41_12220 [Phycisphaerales bacterium]|nr:hypothetical protein [Phycisphaerales bacterium]